MNAAALLRKNREVTEVIPQHHSALLHDPHGAVLGFVDEFARRTAEKELFGLGVMVAADDHGAAGEIAAGLEDGFGK